MGFISYNLNFYEKKLQTLENTSVTPDSLYIARQLLRMLDDLADEGYTELNEQLEKAFFGVSRLRKYLRINRVLPFSISKNQLKTDSIFYSEETVELQAAIVQTMQTASSMKKSKALPFANNLHGFCRRIGYDDKTAYVFLLRDTLLPFVYYSSLGRKRIYPWLLSRKSFAFLTGQQNADDEIRSLIYKALETGVTDFQSFSRFVLPNIQQTITRYPQAKATLCSMLANIDAERILVVESGCVGTFPLLLMSLDNRVDVRMYTTYPYLADILKTRIFTSRYEENRMFETLSSQELYVRFFEIRNEMFYVQKCTDAAVKQQALQEIKMMLK